MPRDRGSANGIELAPAGVPLPRPLPARSWAERGEGGRGIWTSSNGIELRPKGPPPPGPLPRYAGEGENSIPFPKVRRTSLPHAVCYPLPTSVGEARRRCRASVKSISRR